MYFIQIICYSVLMFNICRADFPNEIQKCNYGDTICIRDRANEIVNKYPNGYPPLKVPNLEPFVIDRFDLSQGNNSPISFNLTTTDSKFYGLSKFNFTKFVGFEKDFLKSKFEIYGIVPKMTCKANYKIGGKLLVFPIQGEGEAFYDMDNVKIAIKSKPKVSKVVNGKTYMKIDKYKVLLDVDNMYVNMTNLFNGDKTLSDNMNKIMNENWKIMWDEFSPSVGKITAEFTKNIINEMFDEIAYEDAFLN